MGQAESLAFALASGGLGRVENSLDDASRMTEELMMEHHSQGGTIQGGDRQLMDGDVGREGGMRHEDEGELPEAVSELEDKSGRSASPQILPPTWPYADPITLPTILMLGQKYRCNMIQRER